MKGWEGGTVICWKRNIIIGSVAYHNHVEQKNVNAEAATHTRLMLFFSDGFFLNFPNGICVTDTRRANCLNDWRREGDLNPR